MYREYDGLHKEKWIVSDKPDEEPNCMCDCGSTSFKVCFWDYPFTGCFLKLACTECGKEFNMFDDFS